MAVERPWIEFAGYPQGSKKCPVKPSMPVRYQIRCRKRSDVVTQQPIAARGLRWTNENSPGDIIAYQEVPQ